MTLTYDDALSAPLLTRAQEKEALRRWQEDDSVDALETLMLSHARLVFAAARRIRRSASEMDDLVAAGLLGLMRAADRFDRDRDVRFATYASWWIMNALSAEAVRLRAVVSMPARLYHDARQGRLDGPERDRVLSATQGWLCLDARRDADSDQAPADLLASDAPTPEDCVMADSERARLRAALDQALADLDGPEREVVRRRGFDREDSIETIAIDLGTTPDRVRRVETRAFARLRQSLLLQGISPAGMA